MGKKLFSEKEGLVAAALIALYGVLYLYMAILIKASLAVHLSALSCLLAVMARESEKKIHWLLLGFVLGLLMLLRGNFLALVPVVLVWAFAEGRSLSLKARTVRVVFVLLGVAIPIAPVTARNYSISGELVLTTSQGGANFYIGNSPYANGSYASLPFVRPGPLWEAKDFRAEAESRAGKQLSPSEVSQFWFKESLRFLSDNPAAGFKLFIKKTRLMLHWSEVPDNYEYDFMRSLFMPVLWLGVIGYGMLLGPAVMGMVLSIRSNRGTWHLVLFSSAYFATVVLTFVVSRYRVPLVPVLAVFAARFVFIVIDYIRAESWRPLILCAAPVVAITVVSFWPMPEFHRSYSHGYNLIGTSLTDQGNYELAIDYLERAVSLDPDNVEALFNLGVAQQFNKNFEKAEKVYYAALQRKPDHRKANYNLGLVLLYQGKFAPALKYLHKARSLDPDDPALLANIGAALDGKGRTEQAIKVYTEALEIDPDYKQAINNLAVAYWKLGDCENAWSYYNKTVELKGKIHPEFTEAMNKKCPR